MSVSLVYINAADRAEALRIGRALVDSGLAAAANVMSEVSAIYRWRGEICETTEALLVIKTQSALVDEVVNRVCALHSYECPSVVAVPVSGGNAGYMDWVISETGSAT